MNIISVSQLKSNPASALTRSEESPVAIQKRNKIQAYIVGKEIFESIINHFEDFIDKSTISKTNFKKGRDFETVAEDLGI